MPRPKNNENNLSIEKLHVLTLFAFAIVLIILLGAFSLSSSLLMFIPLGLIVYACFIAIIGAIFDDPSPSPLNRPRTHHHHKENSEINKNAPESEKSPSHVQAPKNNTENREATQNQKKAIIWTQKSPLDPPIPQQKSSPRPIAQIDITKKPPYPTSPVERNIFPSTTPPVTQELALSYTPKEKAEWVLKHCQQILNVDKDGKIPEGNEVKFEIQEDIISEGPARRSKKVGYQLCIITLPSNTGLPKNICSSNTKETDDALKEQTKKISQKIEQEYHLAPFMLDDRSMRDDASGRPVYMRDTNRFDSYETFIPQKVIDRKIELEWEKTQFTKKISDLFSKLNTNLSNDERNFINNPEIRYFSKTDNEGFYSGYYGFYSIKIAENDARTYQYLQWLQNTINKHIFEGRDVVKINNVRDIHTLETTSTLEVLHYRVHHILQDNSVEGQRLTIY